MVKIPRSKSMVAHPNSSASLRRRLCRTAVVMDHSKGSHWRILSSFRRFYGEYQSETKGPFWGRGMWSVGLSAISCRNFASSSALRKSISRLMLLQEVNISVFLLSLSGWSWPGRPHFIWPPPEFLTLSAPCSLAEQIVFSVFPDKEGLERDAVNHLSNGSYGLVKIKLGGEQQVYRHSAARLAQGR